MSLVEYRRKRRFSETPEPRGKIKKGKGHLRFVVQMHEASRLHYDFRIEIGGTYRSWAVPKGPSLSPLDQRLAVKVENHPMDYGSFEGIIPKGNYGAGTVMVWDTGTILERGSRTREESEKALQKGFDAGHITLLMNGEKLKGEFALIRLKKGGDDKAWLLIKKRDEFASYKTDVTKQDRSVLTGRTMREIAGEATKLGDVWVSGKGHQGKPSAKMKAAVDKSTRALEAPKIPEDHRPPAPGKVSSVPVPKATVATTKRPKPETLPRSVKPMLAAHGKALFQDKNWIFEPAHEGHRAIAVVDGSRSHLYSRQQLSFDRRFPEILGALKQLPGKMVLDGDITEAGTYVVHDLLHLDGKSYRDLPLLERKKKLATLKLKSAAIEVADYHVGSLPAKAVKGLAYAHAKAAHSPYKAGTSGDWLKIKVGDAPAKARIADPSEAKPILTHLDKVYWPNDGYTKKDLIEYYRAVAPTILPHLKDRPESLNRHPNGITGESFYQKDLTGYLPKFLKTERFYSDSSAKTIHFALCQNESSLLYLANLGCIELNPWSSRVGTLDHPDFVIIDLDPDDSNDFEEVIAVARETNRVLESIGVQACVKTSGATGMHICVPVGAKYDYDTVRGFAEAVCRQVHKAFPKNTSLERNPARRRGKIYLDFMQNARGQTLAAPYCVRPKPGATVSAPLAWKEVKKGLRPAQFTIDNMVARIRKVGDLWAPMLTGAVDIEKALKRLLRLG